MNHYLVCNPIKQNSIAISIIGNEKNDEKKAAIFCSDWKRERKSMIRFSGNEVYFYRLIANAYSNNNRFPESGIPLFHLGTIKDGNLYVSGFVSKYKSVRDYVNNRLLSNNWIERLSKE